MEHLGLKRGQNEVLGPYHAQNALVFSDIGCYDKKLYLGPDGGQIAEKIC